MAMVTSDAIATNASAARMVATESVHTPSVPWMDHVVSVQFFFGWMGAVGR